ncbi:MAG: hypothetical protein M3349_08470 [Actinomycetota bacterium]|nr:hypothetical protein [Actinomycetota bacterium]
MRRQPKSQLQPDVLISLSACPQRLFTALGDDDHINLNDMNDLNNLIEGS